MMSYCLLTACRAEYTGCSPVLSLEGLKVQFPASLNPILATIYMIYHDILFSVANIISNGKVLIFSVHSTVLLNIFHPIQFRVLPLGRPVEKESEKEKVTSRRSFKVFFSHGDQQSQCPGKEEKTGFR